MIYWWFALPVFLFSPALGTVLLAMFSLFSLSKIFASLRDQSILVLILLSQLCFHGLSISVNVVSGLPLYTPIIFAVVNLFAFLLALGDRQSMELRARWMALFILFFVGAVVADFIIRQPFNGQSSFMLSFRNNLEIGGRSVGSNVFAYSLVLVTVICYNFTSVPILLKRIVAALCFLGIIMISARMALLVIAIFLTFLCEDPRTRRYWMPTVLVLSAILFWAVPDLLSSLRFARLIEGSDTSTDTRLLLYLDFARIFDAFFFGHGHGAYFLVTGLSLHNDFVEIMYSSGVTGFFLFYGGQFATYLLATAGGRRIDRKVISLFLLQFGFSLTESLSISVTSYTGVAFYYLLYSLVVLRISVLAEPQGRVL